MISPGDADADAPAARGAGTGAASPAFMPATDLRADDADVAPLSFGQQRLWVLERLLPDKSVYVVPNVQRLSGPLDVPALARSLGTLVARHEILRTRFAMIGGEPRQVVAPPSALALPVVDLADTPAAGREARARQLADDDAATAFDLERGPLFRARLLRLAPDEHWLLFTLHHIVTDRWSTAIIAREVSSLYAAFVRGAPSPLPELPLQYADFAAWQRERLHGEALERHLAYWRTALADVPVLALPVDHRRPAIADHTGGRLTFAVDAGLTQALKDLAQRRGATLFMTLLAAFFVLLHRWSGQDDIAVGVPTAGRAHPDLEGLIGFFVNTLVLRGDLAGTPRFDTLLARVRVAALDAYRHQELPFEKLVEEISPARDLGRSPLFQVSFALQNMPAAPWTLSGLVARPVAGIGADTAKFDLSLTLVTAGDALTGRIEYATALFDADTIERMLGHFRTLLGAIVADPAQRIDRLALADAALREHVPVARTPAPMPCPDEVRIHRLVEAVAARTPSAPAVVDGEHVLTYANLNAGANRLARRLRAKAPATAPRIGLCFERGADLVVAMLAVLKAGGAYVPLDADWPAERLAHQLSDADVALVVTTAALLPRVPVAGDRALCVDRDAATIAGEPGDEDPGATTASPLACVMYTSGSTGAPKGVAIGHRSIVHLVTAADYVRLDATDAVAHAANPAFDAATFEIWGALVNGAQIVVVPRAVLLSPRDFAALLQREQITTVFLTTALFNQMARDVPDAFRGCRTVLFGGEAVEPRWAKAVLDAAPPARLLHVYGPTEATTFATWHEVRAVAANAATIPIGRPIAGTEAYILDADGEPVGVGLPGELHLGGPGLATGYLNQPAATAERFVRHPFSDDPHARLYRTGDRARWRADGAIEFLGRRDRQVKLRGHRIELAEIEAAIADLPQVRAAAVALAGDTTDTRRLVAWVVPAATSGPPPSNLWGHLKRILPDYMLPASIVWLKALPLNANGKIDWRALPTAASPGAPDAGARVAPRDMLEQVLARIWERLLDVATVGVFDHFFELGGHSLLAARLFDDVEHETGLKAPLAALFADDTIAGLGAALRGGGAGFDAPIVALNDGGTRAPLVFLHGDLTGGGFYCRSLARALGPDQPVLVVQPHGQGNAAIPETIEAMAADRIRALRTIRPHGPYVVGGYCNGAFVGFEMARQLAAAGDDVPAVIVIEARAPQGDAMGGTYVTFDRSGAMRMLAPQDRASEALLRYTEAMNRYAGGPWPRHLVLVRSQAGGDAGRDLGWGRFASSVEVRELPGDHVTLVTRNVDQLAAAIRGALERAQRGPPC